MGSGVNLSPCPQPFVAIVIAKLLRPMIACPPDRRDCRHHDQSRYTLIAKRYCLRIRPAKSPSAGEYAAERALDTWESSSPMRDNYSRWLCPSGMRQYNRM